MKTILKPARIAFYLLMLLTFFVVGLYIAGLVDAGKGQGLAGGAIVFGYGVISAGIAFVLSFFIAHLLPHKILKILNWLLLVLFILLCGFKYMEFKERDKKQQEENQQFKPRPTTSEPTTFVNQIEGWKLLRA